MNLRAVRLVSILALSPLLLLTSCVEMPPDPKKEFHSTRAGNDNTYPNTYRPSLQSYVDRPKQ